MAEPVTNYPNGVNIGTAATGAEFQIDGVAMTATSAELNAIAGNGLSSAELAVLDGVTPGTALPSKAMVLDASSNITGANNTTQTGASTSSAGAAAAAVAFRLGATATEGWELKVIDEVVTTGAIENDLTQNVPAGAVILSGQMNVATTLTGGSTTVTVSLGITGDVDKYGTLTADLLAADSKGDLIPDYAVLASAEDVKVIGAATGGATAGDTALTVGTVRVRIVYAQLNSLDNT